MDLEKDYTTDELIENIEQWGEDRGFYDEENGTTSEKQFLKLIEEVGETAGHLARGKDIKDDLGDCFVVLVGIARLNKLSIRDCIEIAYNEIKDRKGKMVKGVFVKESDLK